MPRDKNWATQNLKNNTLSNNEYQIISSLNFAEDKAKLIWSYVIRLVGFFLFAIVFAAVAKLFHPGLTYQSENYLNIGIENIPHWLSIVMIIIDVLFVLYLHELIHAGVFYFSVNAPPQIGVRGPIIFAAAPGYLNTRNMMILNALAPFMVISIIGLGLIVVLPLVLLPWIFIPTVVNAAAAGGDFMAVWWLWSLSNDSLIEDNGDVLTAYQRIHL